MRWCVMPMAIAGPASSFTAAASLHRPPRQSLLQRGEVSRHQWGNVRVQDGRRGALEFAVFGQDVGGQGDVEPARRGQRPDRRLVRGVGEGEEQADGKRPGARGHNLVQDRPDLRRVQRHERLAVRGHPFRNLEAQIVGDGQPARRKRQPVERRPRLPADGEHVAEAGRGDQRGPGAPVLQHGVGRDRGAMRDDRVRGDAERGQPAQQRDRGIGPGGEQLEDADGAAVAVDQIGERPADVHTDDGWLVIGHGRCSTFYVNSPYAATHNGSQCSTTVRRRAKRPRRRGGFPARDAEWWLPAHTGTTTDVASTHEKPAPSFAIFAHPFYHPPMTFTHLEVHSHFTLLGATPSVPALAARARERRDDPPGADRHQRALRRGGVRSRLP